MLDKTQKQLIDETSKWHKKAAEALKSAKAVDKKGDEFLTNINAYMSDTNHFLEKKDCVRAFEAVVWAWAWIEIGKEIGVIRETIK